MPNPNDNRELFDRTCDLNRKLRSVFDAAGEGARLTLPRRRVAVRASPGKKVSTSGELAEELDIGTPTIVCPFSTAWKSRGFIERRVEISIVVRSRSI